jgi:integrase
MISAGASIKAVQRALGHASAKVTLDTHAGLFEDDLESLADRLDERIAAMSSLGTRTTRWLRLLHDTSPRV